MQKIQCDAKPHYLCLDDSSGAGINTGRLAPGAPGPRQEEDLSKRSIMDERRSESMESKRRRMTTTNGEDMAGGEGLEGGMWKGGESEDDGGVEEGVQMRVKIVLCRRS